MNVRHGTDSNQRDESFLPRHQVKLEYADFISCFPWDYYGTITFRQARCDGLYWTKRAFQVLEKFNATRAFVAVEPHSYEGIHLHLLSRHLPKLDASGSLWKYCFKAFGRTTFEKIDDAIAVSRYCSKYVVKGNDFDFCGSASAWKYDKL